MTLNSSGPISLAGTTAGVSIEVELGGGGTTQISLNDANVRALAGVPSGAITMPTNFYGKSSASGYYYSILGTNPGIGGVYGGSLYVDSSDNTYTVSINLNTNRPIVTKVNSSGSIVWQTGITDNAFSYNGVNCIAVDSSGNVYIAWGGLYVVSLNSSGAWRWTRSIINSNSNIVNIIIDGSGNINVVWLYYSAGPGTYATYVSVFNSSGTYSSTFGFQNSPNSSLTRNPVYYDGTYFYASFQYSGNLPATPYLIKFNSSGISWSKYPTNSNINSTGSVAVDSSGNVYQTAKYNPTGTPTYYIAKYNSSGVFQSAQYISSPSTGSNIIFYPYASVCDSSNNVYVISYLNDTRYGRSPSLHIAKYNSSLSLVWSNQLIGAPVQAVSGNTQLVPYGLLGSYPSLLLNSSGSYLYIFVESSSSLVNQGISGISGNVNLFKLPTDGSLTGNTFVTNGTQFLYQTYSISLSSLTLGISNGGDTLQTPSFSPSAPSLTATTSNLFTSISYASTATTGGSATYIFPGTYSWLCPSGVTSVSAVCVGGGGPGGNSATQQNFPAGGGGGGGGGLGYKNNISVSAGSSYTVFVGAGGTFSPNSGQTSYFISTGTVYGGGGSSGANNPAGSAAGGSGGGYAGDGGGNGGSGGSVASISYGAGGGGGAGGYAGSGGGGGSNGGSGGAGSGGGGGGGSYGNATGASNAQGGGGGGGVGVIGQGASGAGGSDSTTNANQAKSGYGGLFGNPATLSSTGVSGGNGLPAGGGGGGGSAITGCCCGPFVVTGYSGSGAPGIVRLIWPGSSRSFPSTNTGAP